MEKQASSHWTKDLVAIPSVLLLEDVQIRGAVHFEPRRGRFSDVWETLLRERRDYLPVTDAEISTIDGEAIANTDFILVDRHDVRGAYPLTDDNPSDPRARKLALEAVRSAVFTSTFRVEGRIHFAQDRPRFSDAWESLLFDRRRYIPVTEAVITDHTLQRPIGEAAFLIVDKEQVLAVQPLESKTARSGGRPVNRQAVEVTLVLDGVRVDGTVWLERGRPGFDRFSDNWDVLIRDTRRFVPVTSARIYAADGEEAGAAEFLVVDKRMIRVAYPLAG